MRYVIRNKAGEYLVKKDSWSTTWSPNLNDARLFSRKGDVTIALGTMNDSFCTPIDTSEIEMVQVSVVLTKP